ncbi:MAG: DUF5011 domain-containing protein [bacterium]|nr:DUF5011 domain-containing protein [bacterium]
MYNEEQSLRKISNTRKKHVVITIMIISFLLMIVLGVGLYFYIDSRPLIKIPIVTFSNQNWTTDNVILTVTNDPQNVQAYSFDGGVTWGDSNTYTVSENGNITVQLLDIKGKTSKKVVVSVQNIDREAPTMFFENTTTVQLGNPFSVRTGVQVSDKSSGLNGDYTVTPSVVDTSIEGEYILTYSAFDKAGNFVEKNRTIIVRDVKGRTYYRYREGKIHTYQCEPYLCNCVTSSSALETGSCPTGYRMSDSMQCCQTCHKTCSDVIWGEWSEWQQEKVTATSTREVEMMIKES